VEQKNYSIVRRAAGSRQHDTPGELQALNELYTMLRLYTNFFQSPMKLIEKTRIRSKVLKKYDQAKPPYRRVLESGFIPDEPKKELEQIYTTLNPAKLDREVNQPQDRLDEPAQTKHKAEQKVNLEYISP